MHQRNKLITPPAVEPVSLAEAKQHCRVDFPDDDAVITGMILAARLFCEKELRRTFVTQTWETYLDYWPWQMGSYRGSYIPQIQGYPYTPWSTIQVDNPDLLSVASISYVDVNGVVQALDPAMYQVELRHPGESTPPTARAGPPYGQCPVPS